LGWWCKKYAVIKFGNQAEKAYANNNHTPLSRLPECKDKKNNRKYRKSRIIYVKHWSSVYWRPCPAIQKMPFQADKKDINDACPLHGNQGYCSD
jgi:hypothetical protein